jgi:hypothetical protein
MKLHYVKPEQNRLYKLNFNKKISWPRLMKKIYFQTPYPVSDGALGLLMSLHFILYETFDTQTLQPAWQVLTNPINAGRLQELIDAGLILDLGISPLNKPERHLKLVNAA